MSTQSETSFGAQLVTAIRGWLKEKGSLSISALNAPALEKLANETLAAWLKAQKPKSAPVRPVAPMKADEIKKLFSVLCDLSGIRAEELTNRQTQKDISLALIEIRRATPGVDEAEIRRRAALYLKAWAGIKFTALGLSKHWAEFSRGQPVPPKAEPWHPECPNWRVLLADTACRVQGSPLFSDSWPTLSDDAKREAWKRHNASRYRSP